MGDGDEDGDGDGEGIDVENKARGGGVRGGGEKACGNFFPGGVRLTVEDDI